jgi:hypothetical protein
MHHHDEQAPTDRQPGPSRAMVGRPPGLDWPQTFVLKAAGDLALELWERRLTLDQVEHRLAVTTRISRTQIEAALDPLVERGYLVADDGYENADIVLTLMPKGLEEYCQHFVQGYRSIGPAILKLVCHDPWLDVTGLSHRAGRPELLVEHVLDVAANQGLLRVKHTGEYALVVTWISPQLRRWLAGTR